MAKIKESSSTSSFGTTHREGHDSTPFYARKMYDQREISEGKPRSVSSENEISDECLDRAYCHSSESMHELPDSSVHLMVTSPPYNVGKDYDEDLTLAEYRELLFNVFQETHRVLTEGGRACVNIANVGRKPYVPLNALITQTMIDVGFLMRGEVIWDKGASAGVSCAWGSWLSASNPVLRDTHEYILIFCKDSFKRANPRDAESSILRDEFLEWTKSIWRFPAESARRVGHPAPFPVELPSRLIKLYTFVGDIVLDPFMGSGSTAMASVQNNRHWIGYDTSDRYCELTRSRVQQLK